MDARAVTAKRQGQILKDGCLNPMLRFFTITLQGGRHRTTESRKQNDGTQTVWSTSMREEVPAPSLWHLISRMGHVPQHEDCGREVGCRNLATRQRRIPNIRLKLKPGGSVLERNAAQEAVAETQCALEEKTWESANKRTTWNRGGGQLMEGQLFGGHGSKNLRSRISFIV